ncbi:gastrula zinc finger protein XlCGF57.1-like [Battus philenor]|uniref:gastrula zinc finger protein XlCGF57.1-like n=1 Tax=Battus philenor TaxID=42288 RepID=UPI0035CF795F
MNSDDAVTMSALKFVCGESDHVCRLCFATTEKKEISIGDSVRMKRYYYDETVTYVTMFRDLGVSQESLMPQVLCASCATSVVNCYLFHKLCTFSNYKWNEILEQLNESLKHTHSISNNTQSVYLIINKTDKIMFTSRKSYAYKNKKIALSKIKEIMKGRQKYDKIKEGVSELICDECGERFTSNLLLIKHMRLHTKYSNPCSRCPKIFSTPLQLEEHAERVHYPKRLKCNKCTKMFSTERMLKIHNSTYHVAAVCKRCSIQFPSKKALRAHMNKHEPHRCSQCNKNFTNKHTYKFHLKTCGSTNEKLPSFFCDICNKGYIRKNGLRTHLKTDHGFGNVLSCKWCDKKFDAISRLKNHIVKHTRERNFSCDQCGGKFVTKAALIYHIRLHTGERPFPCDLCNESFLSASRRMEHKRRKHFGPTQECHICHVKFVTGQQLKKHVQRHFNPHSKLYVATAVPRFSILANN